MARRRPWKFAAFTIFCRFWAFLGLRLSNSHIMESTFWYKIRSKTGYSGRKIFYFHFFITLSHFWVLLKKKNHSRFFTIFFQSKYVYFPLLYKLTPKKWCDFAKFENHVFGLKKIREVSKKSFFFSGLARNSVKLSKNAKYGLSTDEARFRAIFGQKIAPPPLNMQFWPF